MAPKMEHNIKKYTEMKKIGNILLLAGFIFLTSGQISAKEINKESAALSISGQVLDQTTGEVLAGVKVEIEDSAINKKIYAYTDLDGNFQVEGLKPGTYQLSTSFISYTTKAFNLNLKNQEEYLELTLSPVK